MIEVKNLTKSYGQRIALHNVSFEVAMGEVVGLLGPNGAGKTTILSTIAGVIFPDAGQVYINHQRLSSHERELKKQIGFLAEDNPLYSHLFVIESLQLAADLKGMTRQEFADSFAQVSQRVGITDVLQQPIDTLSKGYRQRVGFAQALINQPPILILDEPTEGLDPNQRQEIRNLIRELRENHTILMSTHVMQEVEAICQRVVILNKGEVVKTGTLKEIEAQSDQEVEIELIIKGQRALDFLTRLEQEFASRRDADRILVRLKPEQEKSFYQFLGRTTFEEAYLSHLKKKEIGLEEAFQRYTQN